MIRFTAANYLVQVPIISYLVRILGEHSRNNGMIYALLKYYNIHKRAMEVNVQVLFFGLEDVIQITGLRVNSSIVTSPRDNLEFLANEFLKEVHIHAKCTSISDIKLS